MLGLAAAPLHGQPARQAPSGGAIEARVQRILAATPLIDGHNDLAENLRDRVGDRLGQLDISKDQSGGAEPLHTDIPRLRRGGVGGVFFAAFVSSNLDRAAAVQVLFEQIDVIRRFAARYPDTFALATSAADVEHAHRLGRIAALIGIENGQAIGESLAVLRQAYVCGARYMTLAHWQSHAWADSATDAPRHNGLTRFGREVVREMNRLGMLVDLSHVSDKVMLDALGTSAAPVIFSHSSARALCNHRRDVPDEILRRVRVNGGIVMVNFAPNFISEEVRIWSEPLEVEWRRLGNLYPNDETRVREGVKAWIAAHPAPKATLAQVADHIEHIRTVAGIDHVGLGSDFDGITQTPVGLEDVSHYPALLAELLRRGWSDEDAAKLVGGNILRVMRAAERVAARLQREREPSDAHIEDLDAPAGTAPTAAPK
jgi:membrane dipeptidase